MDFKFGDVRLIAGPEVEALMDWMDTLTLDELKRLKEYYDANMHIPDPELETRLDLN